MPVLPVTQTRPSGLPSARRFCFDASVGAKCQRETTSTAWRLNSSGQGLYRSFVRRPDVPHGYPLVEGRERRREGGGGVAVDEHAVGPLGLEHGLDPEQHVAGDVVKRLPRLHDRQVVVRSHVEGAQHLVEHLAVLAGDAHDRLELVRTGLELVHERAHLDGLRPRAEDEQDFLFIHFK